MGNFKNYLINGLISLVICIAVLAVYNFTLNDNVAYVKTGLVLQKYKGMIEANKQYEKEMTVVQKNLDTLKSRYVRLYEMYTNGKKTANIENNLSIAEKEYNTYREKSEQQMNARQQELTAGVYEKVNLCLQEFGKKHRYKIILGATTSGNIMYGRNSDDITDEIVKILNSQYDEKLTK